MTLDTIGLLSPIKKKLLQLGSGQTWIVFDFASHWFFFPFLFLFSSFFNTFVFLSNFQTRTKFEDCWAIRREIWQASWTHRRRRFPSVVLIVIYTWLYILDKKNFESRILRALHERLLLLFFFFSITFTEMCYTCILWWSSAFISIGKSSKIAGSYFFFLFHRFVSFFYLFPLFLIPLFLFKVFSNFFLFFFFLLTRTFFIADSLTRKKKKYGLT